MNSFPLVIAGLVLLAHAPAVYCQDIFLMAAFDQTPHIATVKWLEQQAEQIFSEAGLTLVWQPRKPRNEIPVGAIPYGCSFTAHAVSNLAYCPPFRKGRWVG